MSKTFDGVLRDEVTYGLLYALGLVDQYTKEHSERTARYARQLAIAMGCLPKEVQDIYHGALLHDIGKIGTPCEILKKPCELTSEEYKDIKQHPSDGAALLECFSCMQSIIPLVRHHHEMFCGDGYPDGLVGEAIPFGARVIAVADAYDALTSDRCYRPARAHDEALKEILAHVPDQFDPKVVDVFKELELRG